MADVPAHEIVIVPAVGEDGREALRQQCYDVRIDVFHHEQRFPLETEIDEYVPIPILAISIRVLHLDHIELIMLTQPPPTCAD